MFTQYILVFLKRYSCESQVFAKMGSEIGTILQEIKGPNIRGGF